MTRLQGSTIELLQAILITLQSIHRKLDRDQSPKRDPLLRALLESVGPGVAFSCAAESLSRCSVARSFRTEQGNPPLSTRKIPWGTGVRSSVKLLRQVQAFFGVRYGPISTN